MTELHSFVDVSLMMVGRACWYATLVVPIAWLICGLLHRAPRQFHCWVWRLAYIKVAVATLWMNPISLPVLPIGEPTTVTVGAESGESWRMGEVVQSSHDMATSTEFRGWSYLLFFGWCVGAAWLIARCVQEWVLSLQVRRTSISCESKEVLRSYQQAAAAMGVSRPPELVLTNELSIPALVGIGRPVVAIPEGFENRVASDELGLVLRHELSHFRRLDLVWSLLPRLVSFALFFHPLIWLANYRWRISQECACDELVLKVSCGDRRCYAGMLVNVARLSSENGENRFATIGIVGSFRTLRERITVMQDSAVWSKKAVKAAYFAMIISCFAIVPWQLEAQPWGVHRFHVADPNGVIVNIMSHENTP